MRLTPSKRNLLARLTNGPKDIRMFSHGDTGSSQMSFHYPRYLLEMQQAGYVYEEDGKWSITKVGRHYLEAENSRFASGEKYTTWKTNALYDGKELQNNHTRPGCYDFMKYPSLYRNKRVYLEA